MRISLLRFQLLVACVTFTASSSVGQEVAFHRGATVRFASVEEGAAVLRQEDVFTRSLSHFDLQARLKTADEVTSDDLRRFAAKQVEAWTVEEVQAITPCLESLRHRLKSLAPLFPDTVLLIKTTGKEEGEAAYCRQNAIVLPRSMLRRAPDALERLLAHELFHILSRHDAERQRRLYAVVRFRFCGGIEIPQSLRDRRITNPDAPLMNYLIELNADGPTVPATPILLASAKRFDPTLDKTFFQYMQFRLLQLEQSGTQWRAALDERGQPILLDPRQTASYHEQIGRNTGYIIHPEEVLAENFVHLAFESPNLPTPHIVQEMRVLLTDSEPGSP